MKLVLVGWLSALVSFGIGFALGRRARRRDAIRDAMLQVSTSMAAHAMMRDAMQKLPTTAPNRPFRGTPITREEAEAELACWEDPPCCDHGGVELGELEKPCACECHK